MRFRFRFISFLLLLTMLVSSCVGTFAQADDTASETQEAAKNQLIYYDGYETYSLGATSLNGYVGSKTNNEWKVTEGISGGKNLKLTVKSSSSLHLDRTFGEGEVTESFVVSLDVIFADYNNVVKALYIDSTSSTNVCLVKFLPSGTVTLADGTKIANYGLNKSYRLSVAVDTSANTANIYFNGKKRAANVSLGSKAVADLTKVHFHMRDVAGHSVVYIDNLSVYTGEKPLDGEEYNSLVGIVSGGNEDEQGSASGQTANVSTAMKNTVALYVSKNCALVRGVKTVIDASKPNIIPYWDADTAMIPLKFFAQSLGGAVGWDAQTSLLTMDIMGRQVKLKSGETAIEIDGQSLTIAHAPQTKDGTAYVPAEDICELIGVYCFTDISDLIIYGTDEHNFTWANDGALLRKIAESFIYDDVEGAEIINSVKERWPNQGHPRLVMTDEKFEAIRQNLASSNPDPVYVSAKKSVVDKADRYIRQPSSGWELRDDVRLYMVSAEIQNEIIYCAMAYQLTLEDKYAERAWLAMFNACSFPNWHPWHMLDVGAMAQGVGLGYDWLYNWLDENQRKMIKDALVEHALNNVINDHTGNITTGSDHKDPLERSWNWSKGTPVNNWRFIAGGGAATALLAICDELSGQDLANCEISLKQSLLDIRPALSLFAPSGAYPEGLDYWRFAMQYYTVHMSSLLTAAGSDYGYTNAPGLRHTANYIIALNGPSSMFSFGDSPRVDAMIHPPMLWFADKFNDYSAAQARINRIMLGEGNPFDILHYNPRFSDAQAADNASLDAYAIDTEIYAMRSSRDDDAIWTAFHFGDNHADHGQYDMGTFVLDAMGRNFFLDLGKDDYNLPNRFTNTYRYRAEGHNTIVINPEYGPGQVFVSTARIDKHESKPQGAYAISDMTSAYEPWALSMRRGLKLDNYRRMVTLQDEVRLKEVSDFWWFAHTEAEIEISEDGKKAYLDIDGNILLAEIINGENAVFTSSSAVPLPSSPKQPGQADDSRVNKLVIHIPECKDLDLAVTFKCYDAAYSPEDYDNTFIPLDEWSIPDGENVIEYTHADSILINGKPLEGFDPNVYEYEVIADSSDLLWGNRVVTGSAEGGVTVTESVGVNILRSEQIL